jgi:hypothetical protein
MPLQPKHSFLALAHRSFISLAIFALAAGLMVRFRAGLAGFDRAAILFAVPPRILADSQPVL